MWRRTARDRVFISFLVLATVVVLTLDFRTGLLDGVAGTATQVVGVMQSGVRAFVRPFEAVVRSVGDLGSLREENARLRRENLDLRRQASAFSDVLRENARVRALLQLQEGSGLRGVYARVISSSSGLERSVMINKGRRDGISPDHGVLAPEGLAGRVVWAGSTTAKVLLLTDAQSAVGVRIGQSGETGLVRGHQGGRNLQLELVSRTALDQGAVKPGDTVVTSGYQGGIFPSGLPVGRVESVDLAVRGTEYTIFVRPFVRFSQLDVISVVVGQAPVIEPEPSPTPETGS